MDLAIVIPYYRIEYFEKTLNSLAKQTNKNFNVYIGNDASPDNPNKLIKQYSSTISIKYTKFDRNIGLNSLVNQWKRCISLINDEKWLMLLGDDDMLSDDAIEMWYEHFEDFNSKSNVIRFSTQLINEKEECTSEIFNHPQWESGTDSFFRKFDRKTRSSLSEYIFSKDSYEKFGFLDLDLGWHSDDRAWLDFSNKKPIYSITDAIIFIRFSESSISGSENNLYLKRKASIKFYESLIKNRVSVFSKTQKIEIIKRYTFLKRSQRPLKLIEWINLLLYYIKFFQLKSFKQFIKAFISNYF